jgi:hypothetical protein
MLFEDNDLAQPLHSPEFFDSLPSNFRPGGQLFGDRSKHVERRRRREN